MAPVKQNERDHNRRVGGLPNRSALSHGGAIWMADYVHVHRQPLAALKEQLNREGANSFTAEMISEAVASLHDPARMSERPFVLFFEPPSMVSTPLIDGSLPHSR